MILTTILVLLEKFRATSEINMEAFVETFKIDIYDYQIVHFFIMIQIRFLT